MCDFHTEVKHDEYERACARIERDAEQFVCSPRRYESIWWTRYLEYMQTLPGFGPASWFSTIEAWLDRLDHYGEPLDDAREEMERMRREGK